MTFRGKENTPVKETQKQFSASKSVTSAVKVTDDILRKINTYALEALVAEDIFVGKQLLSHNGVDRDNERFPETMLDNFAETLPGKSVLYFHANNYLPLGLYFDTKTELMSVEQFKQLTDEDPRLPEGIDQVKVLWAWYYVVKTDDMESTLKNIKGGTYRHWSIRFNAASIVSIKDDPNGSTKYWEYVGPAEALEGSLVWIGAQQGATSQKSPGHHPENQTLNKEKEAMKTLLLKLGLVLGKSFGDDTTEDQATEALKSFIGEKDTKIADLEGQLAGLKSKAELGEKFINDQAGEYARMKVLLGECEETEEGKKAMTIFGKNMGVDFLQTEVKNLEKRVAEKFPDGGQLSGSNGQKQTSDKNPLVVE